MQRLDIAIGPVQGFVAQSRRTRDLWGSSYLLAFLAGHAMHGAEKAGGRIVRPIVECDALYAWIAGERTGEPPGIGSLPNRFAVDVTGDTEASAVARAADAALRSAWARVCDAVWGEFVKDACDLGVDTRAIWDRQTGAFWEVVWTAGPAKAGAEAGLLARRKYWRSHVSPAEPGDKCTVMHDLQELSGHVRSADKGAQNGFWAHIRGRVGPLELRDNERLCAVALVKRLFPRVAEEALGWNVERSRWPSTVHIAARPWLRQVEACVPNLAREYAGLVKQYAPSGVLSERRSPWPDRDRSAAGDFHRLDANWFHREAVGSERRCPLKPDAGDEMRDTLAYKLKKIHSASQDGRRLGPSSFYALLLADGDRLGRLVGETGGEHVGRALAKFTLAAPNIVREHCGETVYAGGDDVLAMLPLTGALRCAEQLADCYRSTFEDRAGATLSAAVMFVHFRYPLTSALRGAHRLLDDVAKDENGRDSLAVGVLKPGGLHSQWVTMWYRDEGRTESSVGLVQKLVKSLEDHMSETGLSSALLYRIRELLIRLCGWGSWRPGVWGDIPADIDLPAFLRAEIGHSLAMRRGDNDEAQVEPMTENMVDLVRRVLQRAHAPADEQDSGTDGRADKIGFDALLLARFLAAGGHSGHEA